MLPIQQAFIKANFFATNLFCHKFLFIFCCVPSVCLRFDVFRALAIWFSKQSLCLINILFSIFVLNELLTYSSYTPESPTLLTQFSFINEIIWWKKMRNMNYAFYHSIDKFTLEGGRESGNILTVLSPKLFQFNEIKLNEWKALT